MTKNRKKIPPNIVQSVLIEAGYRCAVPTCRTILAIDIHHMVEVSEGGGNQVANLLALCPTCHALYHRREISQDAIFSWKGMLVALSNAFDRHAIDKLMFLSKVSKNQETPPLCISGDGVLEFSNLIAADLVSFGLAFAVLPPSNYTIYLTQKGESLISAWLKGDRTAVERVLSGGEPVNEVE